jgi:hypothetical protein
MAEAVVEALAVPDQMVRYLAEVRLVQVALAYSQQ